MQLYLHLNEIKLIFELPQQSKVVSFACFGVNPYWFLRLSELVLDCYMGCIELLN